VCAAATFYRMRCSVRIARQACLVLCQRVSPFGAQKATEEALADALDKIARQVGEILQLKKDLQRAENSRLYLLQKQNALRETSPVDSSRVQRGTKRSVDERREGARF